MGKKRTSTTDLAGNDANEFLERLGTRLRFLRTQKGLSMETHAKQIADHYNIRLRQSYYSKIERGLAAPPLRTLYALADYYDTTVCSLFDMPLPEGRTTAREFLQKSKLLFLLEEFVHNVGSEKAERYLCKVLEEANELFKNSGKAGGIRNSKNIFRAAKSSSRDKK